MTVVEQMHAMIGIADTSFDTPTKEALYQIIYHFLLSQKVEGVDLDLIEAFHDISTGNVHRYSSYDELVKELEQDD